MGLDSPSVSTEAKLSPFAHSLQLYGIRQVGRAKDGSTRTSGVAGAFCCCWFGGTDGEVICLFLRFLSVLTLIAA